MSFRSLALVLSCVAWIAACAAVPEQGDDCQNGRDDDGDDLIDCDDPHCVLLPACQSVDGDPGLCGNSTLDPGEICEDGNRTAGDGCSPVCSAEVNSNCGNFQIDFDAQTGAQLEDCDDGNRLSGDRCNAACRLEYCGDGIVQLPLGEQCDDGPFGTWVRCSGACLTQ